MCVLFGCCGCLVLVAMELSWNDSLLLLSILLLLCCVGFCVAVASYFCGKKVQPYSQRSLCLHMLLNISGFRTWPLFLRELPCFFSP
jgi:hypothetical protein